MSTRILYFKNTSGSHFKDYRITWDQTTQDVTIEYGKIGGSKTTMVESFPNETLAYNFVMEKSQRRLDHDYVLVSDMVTDPAAGIPIAAPSPAPVEYTKSRSEFAKDLADMKNAERYAS